MKFGIVGFAALMLLASSPANAQNTCADYREWITNFEATASDMRTFQGRFQKRGEYEDAERARVKAHDFLTTAAQYATIYQAICKD